MNDHNVKRPRREMLDKLLMESGPTPEENRLSEGDL